MPKFKQKNKNDSTRLVCKIGSKETVNTGELAFLQSSDYPGIIRPLCENKNKIKTISYDISNKQALKNYISNSHNKDSFLSILTQISEVIRFCDSNNLSSKKIIFDSSMIFVEPIQKQLLFIYYPAENFQNNSPIEELLRSIARDIVVPQTVDSEFIIEFRKYVETMNYFALVDFERRIEALQSNKEKKAQKKKHISVSNDMIFDLFDDNKDDDLIEPETKQNYCFCSNCNLYFSIGTKFCAECGENLTPIRGNTATADNPPEKDSNFKKNKQVNQVSSNQQKKKRQTKLIREVEEKVYPSLIRIKTNEEVFIKKELFSIGYDENCDYSFTDNEAVSGHHADIITDELNVYIVDDGSTNGTYINDKEIPYCKRILLRDGDKIELADEIFMFKGIESK